MENGPVRDALLENHAAQTGMGVDENIAAHGNQKVDLTRSRLHEQQITALGVARCWLEAGNLCVIEKPCDAAVAQGVANWRIGLDARTPQGSVSKTDAIKAGGGVASVKPEFGPDERRSFAGEAIGERCHLGCGYWASRSLPGRCGSPWKLIALSKRVAQVAMVLSQPCRRMARCPAVTSA